MDWDYGHTACFSSTASGHGLGFTVTQPGLGVQPQGMDWNYGHTTWFLSTASGHGLGLRSHSLILSTASGHGLGLRSHTWFLVRPQSMDWDYGHTPGF
jgi:hypothetical protein